MAKKPQSKKPEPKKPAAGKQQVAVRQSQPLSTGVQPDYTKDAGVGREGMGQQDYAIPRISIVQSLSPQRQRSHANYLEGVAEGDIIDTVENRIIAKGEEGIFVFPISYRRAHIEWVPRAKGGGFVKDHGPDASILAGTQKDPNTGANLLPNGNEVKVSGEYFVFLFNPEADDPDERIKPYLLSMAGVQLRASRKWNTMMSSLREPDGNGGSFNPAMFFSSYHLTTVPEKNQKGAWMGWSVAKGDDVKHIEGGGDIYMSARDFRKEVEAGKVKVKDPVSDDAVPGEDEKM